MRQKSPGCGNWPRTNDDEVLADAANNLNDVADAVEQALATDETADAVNALEQVKSNRKFPW